MAKDSDRKGEGVSSYRGRAILEPSNPRTQCLSGEVFLVSQCLTDEIERIGGGRSSLGKWWPIGVRPASWNVFGGDLPATIFGLRTFPHRKKVFSAGHIPRSSSESTAYSVSTA